MGNITIEGYKQFVGSVLGAGTVKNYEAALKEVLNFNEVNIDSINKEDLDKLKKFYDEILDKNSETYNKMKLYTKDHPSYLEKNFITASLKQFEKYIMGNSLVNNKDLNQNIDKFQITNYPHNRILFGAPGTGKSYHLEEESQIFLNQGQVEEDLEKIIKAEVDIAANGAKKLNALNAIGFKYADYLKNISKSDLAEKYSNIQSISELYVGSRAKEIAEQLIVDPDADDFDKNLTDKIENAKNGKLMLINLNAIGYRYSDYLCEKTLKELKTEYKLESNAQMWWLYRGAQAGQLVSKEDKIQNIKFLERVTFHPNYSYSQFVGTYKPVKSKINLEEITYEYIPGPFMRVYVNAKRNPEKNFLLLIEEINRANVAAVFGDVFQLLDRNSDGASQYPIAASEDQKSYLEACGIDEDEISIPSNMYIWATMNSADQGVLPMDAAFKRRWDFEYIGIDDKQNWGYTIPLPKGESINWNVLRHAINDKLKTISGVNEDKLLGPYFISKAALEEIQDSNADKAKFINTFKSKVLMYLFEDVCKMRPADLFTDITLEDGQTRPHYSDICASFDEKGIGIFGFNKNDLEGKYKES